MLDAVKTVRAAVEMRPARWLIDEDEPTPETAVDTVISMTRDEQIEFNRAEAERRSRKASATTAGATESQRRPPFSLRRYDRAPWVLYM